MKAKEIDDLFISILKFILDMQIYYVGRRILQNLHFNELSKISIKQSGFIGEHDENKKYFNSTYIFEMCE